MIINKKWLLLVFAMKSDGYITLMMPFYISIYDFQRAFISALLFGSQVYVKDGSIILTFKINSLSPGWCGSVD